MRPPNLPNPYQPGRPTPPGGHRPMPPRPQPTMHPRKVRAGIKLASKEGPVSAAWPAQRWMRLVESLAANEAAAEGLAYARLGQTRVLEVRSGHITARVQGRMPQAWVTDIRLPTFTHEQWEQVVDAMTHDARFLASLLGGEVPANIEDLFAPLKLRLFPHEASDITASCTCGHAASSGQAWCKHACCAMALVAERLALDTFLIFQLRGIAREDLLERLRQRRAVVSSVRAGVAGERLVPAYSPRLPGVGEPAPLDASIDHFWVAPPEAELPDLTPAPPVVTHPLLRRLGPSPFPGARFPLVGLLATCYDVIGAAAVNESLAPPGAAESGTEHSPDGVDNPITS